jgi:hypothetical protein
MTVRLGLTIWSVCHSGHAPGVPADGAAIPNSLRSEPPGGRQALCRLIVRVLRR